MARQHRIQPARFNVAIVGDGETERIYFLNIRDTDRPKNLTLFPDTPRRIGNYKGVLEKAIELSEDYSRVYALIDMDAIIQQKQQTPYQNHKADAEKKGIIVLENNPCFDIWLLLHFGYTARLFKDCDEVSTLLNAKDRIPGYDKTSKFLTQKKLYQTYKTQLVNQAIPNGKRLETTRIGQDELFPRAQTFEFFEWYFATYTG